MTKPGRPISVGVWPEAARSESLATEMWGLQASVLLKGAMRDRGWGYSELSEALKPLGIKRSATVINRRINRGNFNAGFLIVCLHAMGYTLEVQREER